MTSHGQQMNGGHGRVKQIVAAVDLDMIGDEQQRWVWNSRHFLSFIDHQRILVNALNHQKNCH